MTDLLEQLRGLCREDEGLFVDDLPEDFEEVEEGDFTQDYKYQVCRSIVKHTPTGRHFAIHNRRSGSYHTDWYYSKPEVDEVSRAVKTVEVVEWHNL